MQIFKRHLVDVKRRVMACFFLSFSCLAIQAQVKLPSMDYTPQTPANSLFTRYGDIPIDLSTGVPNIEVPIFTLKSGDLSVPINISYHASGNKVQDISSEVGLGWVLNTGGIITRTILGNIGAGAKPVYKSSSEFDTWINSGDPYPKVWDIQEHYLNPGFYDYYSDRYYYNLGSGESGIFRPDYQTDELKTVPYRPLQIKFVPVTGTLSSDITITNTSGAIYYFKNDGPDLWYLTKILSGNKRDSIMFHTHSEWTSQGAEGDRIKFDTEEAYVSPGAPSNPDNWPPTPPCQAKLLKSPVISGSNVFEADSHTLQRIMLMDSIVTSNGSVVFTYLSDRQETITDWRVPKSRIKRIQVFNKPGNETIIDCAFNQSYFGSTPKSLRLKLNDVTINGQQYSFTYNSMALPEYKGSTHMEDFWGYYNGNPSTSLAPKFDKPLYSANQYNGISKYPVLEYAKACVLQEIKYPTGGRTVFSFELNKVDAAVYAYEANDKPADNAIGGLRIAKIQNFLADNTIANTKRYEYEGDSELENRIRPELYVYKEDYFNYYQEGFGGGLSACPVQKNTTGSWVVNSSPFSPVIGTPGAPLTYKTVTEYLGEVNNQIGKTVYHYLVPSVEYYDTVDPLYRGPFHLDRGNYVPLLEIREDFKFEDSKYTTVRKETNFYGEFKNQSFQTGFNFATTVQLRDFSNSTGIASGLLAQEHEEREGYIINLKYSDTRAWQTVKLPNKTEIVENGNLTLTTLYEYNSKLQVIKKEEQDSKGGTLVTQYKYPSDYSPSQPYKEMVCRNMINPVVEESISKNNANLQRNKTNYGFWDGSNWSTDAESLVVPRSIESQVGAGAIDNRINYQSYDDRGNVTSLSKDGGPLVSYLWGYNKQYPIAQITNAQPAAVIYTDFENPIDYFPIGTAVRDWSVPLAPPNPNIRVWFSFDSFNGRQSCRPPSLTSREVPTGNYVLSFYAKGNGSIAVNGIQKTTTSNWAHYLVRLPNMSSVVINNNNGGVLIDDLYLYPESAFLATYTYKPLVGMTSSTDAKGEATFYEYDSFQRLKTVKNSEGNILKNYNYHYKTQN